MRATATATARTARRRTLRVAAAALTAAAALSLTACSGSDTAAAKPAGRPGAAADAGGTGAAPEAGGTGSAAGAPGTAARPDNATSGSGGATSSRAGSGGAAPSRAGSGNGAAHSGGKSAFCRTGELAMEAVNSSPDQQVGDVTVRMTNKGSRTCSATGFAGVDLKDTDGTSAPVHRGGEQPRVTDLKPGDTATFSISYQVDASGDSLASPTHLIVTPPNETHSVSLKWPADALKLAGPYDDKIQVHPVGIAG
ncbi:DUF4232 domain-containing protein [Streptomyces sp. RS10V-4]|uniref:DUF4232 domain-containing protein n=1 Tax=Streptomyces rhizoryzae TaxID=2932493 RepID=UPI0020034A89|nr:DUF4232 domain-containing protein [Streptomyces rhizoryzae]MCK7626268.1 DUF4232 domain-containing protein [Streptomyces rhizoryzae]